MIAFFAVFIALFEQSFAMPPSHARDVSTAVKVLSRGEPRSVVWKYSQHLDVNCDGHRDEVFMASDAENYYVAAVMGPISDLSKSSVVSFGLGGHHQDSFCGRFETLTPEALSERQALIEALGEEPAGYRFAPNCRGLCLVAGGCDDFHLYWDHDAEALSWWRM